MRRVRAPITALANGLVPLDCDVSPFDNARTHKEGVSRTYKGCDGYAPMLAYLGQEGWCLEVELREGRQHCQKDTPALLARVLERARRLMPSHQGMLLRLDSGNDALENIAVVLSHNEHHPEAAKAHYLIKWNPRKERAEDWLAYAESDEAAAQWSTPRAGKRVALFSVIEDRLDEAYEYPLRRVMRLTERTIDKHGQALLVPELTLEGWWTSLWRDEATIIRLYADHGTSEQFHSEFKTDLDLERFPSGKFATNALVLTCAQLAYNLLRWLGQQGLLGADAPPRHKAKRRRLRTVMQELVYLAARLVRTGSALETRLWRALPGGGDLSAALSAVDGDVNRSQPGFGTNAGGERSDSSERCAPTRRISLCGPSQGCLRRAGRRNDADCSRCRHSCRLVFDQNA